MTTRRPNGIIRQRRFQLMCVLSERPSLTYRELTARIGCCLCTLDADLRALEGAGYVRRTGLARGVVPLVRFTVNQ